MRHTHDQNTFREGVERPSGHSFRPGQAIYRISAPKPLRRANWLGRLVDAFARLIDRRQP